MKTVSAREAQDDLQRVLDCAQDERVLITRGGKPAAMVLGLESHDAEDLETARSSEFWRMIRRRHSGGSPISLAEARTRLEAREKSARD